MLVWYVVMKQTARYWIFRYNYSLKRNWTGNSNDNQCHKKNNKDILTWKKQGFRWHVYIKIFNNFNWKYFLLKYTNYEKLLGDMYISATKKKLLLMFKNLIFV